MGSGVHCDGVLQVRYATGAIRNISVEEVGKRIVKAIPNVLQQLTSLSSSQDQVIFAVQLLQRLLRVCFLSREHPWLTRCSSPTGYGPLRCSSPQELVVSSRWLTATYTFYNRHDGVFHINSIAHSAAVRYLRGLIACVPRPLRLLRGQTL